MAAAQTAKPEICAGTKNLPLFFTTGMGLFHNQSIMNTNIHFCLLSYPEQMHRKLM
jgi:hypothetical protein